MGRSHLIMHAVYFLWFSVIACVLFGFVYDFTLGDVIYAVAGFESFAVGSFVNVPNLLEDPGKALVLSVEVLLLLLVYFDIARAPDVDLAPGSDVKHPVRSVIGTVAFFMFRHVLNVRGHRGKFHSLVGGLFTSFVAVLVFVFVGLVFVLGYGYSWFLLSPWFLLYVFCITFASFVLHLLEDTVTVGGITWFGRHVRGVVHVGENDVNFVVGCGAFSALVFVVCFGLFGVSLLWSAVLGLLSVFVLFALSVVDSFL